MGDPPNNGPPTNFREISHEKLYIDWDMSFPLLHLCKSSPFKRDRT